MKIRNGFVSNSSSSNFCILAIPLEKNVEALKKLLKYEVPTLEEDEREEEDDFDAGEYTGDKRLTSLGIDIVLGTNEDEDEAFFIGLDLTTLKGTALDKIKAMSKTYELLKDLFPNSAPDFYYGEISA